MPSPFLVSPVPPIILSPLSVKVFVSLLNVILLGETPPVITTLVDVALSSKITSSPPINLSFEPSTTKFSLLAISQVVLSEPSQVIVVLPRVEGTCTYILPSLNEMVAAVPPKPST